MDGNDDDYEKTIMMIIILICEYIYIYTDVIYIYTYVIDIYIGETPQCCLWFSLTSIDACYPHDIESLLFLVKPS